MKTETARSSERVPGARRFTPECFSSLVKPQTSPERRKRQSPAPRDPVRRTSAPSRDVVEEPLYSLLALEPEPWLLAAGYTDTTQSLGETLLYFCVPERMPWSTSSD